MILFLCDKCKKQIWQQMPDDMKKSTTIAEAEELCLCADCLCKLHCGVQT